MTTSLNPTLRLFKSRREGRIDYTKVESLEGVKLMSGLPAARVVEHREKISIRPDDVFIATYPKCGTTWMQHIVKLISNNGVENGMDDDVFIPWIDHMSVDEVESMASPRFFKTHLPYNLMAGGGDPASTKAKYIYVIRNPKDAAVSSYHFTKKVYPAKASLSWEEFFEQFVAGDVIYGAFHSHFLGWWTHRHSKNILVVTFEEMKRDLTSVISVVANFLGYALTDEAITKIAEEGEFINMKTNPTANKAYLDTYSNLGSTAFMRTGITGDWENMFTKEQSERMDAIIADKLGSAGLVFDFYS